MAADSISHFMDAVERMSRYRSYPKVKPKKTLDDLAEALDRLKSDRPDEYQLLRQGKVCLFQ